MQGLAGVSAFRHWPVVMGVAYFLVGCSPSTSVEGASSSNPAVSATSSSNSSSTAAGSAATTPVSTGPAAAIAVQGSPATTAVAETAYEFQPSVSPSTATVTFTIASRPAWASFDPATGALTGTPTLADVGLTSNITITANDANGTATIGPFAIRVTAPSGSPAPAPPPPTPPAPTPAGTATLTWNAPTVNTNGSVLDDLAGYHIYYGPSATQLDQEIDLDSASETTYVVGNLTPGTYYFTVTAVNSRGAEGVQSDVVSKTI